MKTLKEIAKKLPLVQEYLISSNEIYKLFEVSFDKIMVSEKEIFFSWNPKKPEKFQAYQNISHGGIILFLADSVGILAMVEAAKQNKRAYTINILENSFVSLLKLGNKFSKVLIKGKIIDIKKDTLVMEVHISQNEKNIFYSRIKYIFK